MIELINGLYEANISKKHLICWPCSTVFISSVTLQVIHITLESPQPSPEHQNFDKKCNDSMTIVRDTQANTFYKHSVHTFKKFKNFLSISRDI